MLHYILQTIVFQAFFLLAYDLFLKKETFFNYNRVYLLATTLLSVILPFIKIVPLKKIVPKNYIIHLPEVVFGNQNQVPINTIEQFSTVSKSSFIWSWEHLFYLGIGIATLIFAYKIFNVLQLIYNNPKRWQGNLLIVNIAESQTAFSFFNYVFIGDAIAPENTKTILQHECVHVQQKHSIDLLFFEILRILFWFNPLIYLYQNRIATVHEFIADEKAIKTENKTAYYSNLLAQVFQVKHISIVNPFFKQSLIKKRIIMLQKSKSKQILKLKYTLLFPMIMGMLFYTSCTQNEANAEPLDQDMEDVVEKFRNQLQTKNSNLSKQERLELADYIINEFKANLEHGDGTKSEKLLSSTAMEKEIPFSKLDKSPIFPGCENESNLRACFSKSISNHVLKNFNSKLANDLQLKGTIRISTQFKIDKTGNIVNIRVRSSHPELEQEAIRVISALPKMTPGEHNGKTVTVPYGLPIKFKIND
ncbi:MAG: M56 family metallopeptidase [Oceanihabitans sp.]